MSETLGTRQGTVLNAVVREYIRTGEPVGSKHVVSRYRLGVSSATVRNDMARLEELLYLVQPHTSAGRIPTDTGYRFFVDHLENPVRLEGTQERAVVEELAREPESLDDLLQRATEVLARLTRSAAAVLAPRLAPSRLRRLDLVRMAPRRLMVVLVADNGRVEQRIASLDRDLTTAALERVAAELNRDLENQRLEEARRRVQARMATASASDRTVLREVVEALAGTLTSEDRVYVGGAANLAEEQTFGRDTLHAIYDVLERQHAVLQLLAGALEGPTTVRIGSELPLEQMQACSLVVANYEVAGRPLGSVGIIGPTRMDYRRALAGTSAVARTLGRALDSFQG